MTENDEVQNAPENGAADEPTELTDKPKKAVLTAEELGHILMFRHKAKLEERQASRLQGKSDGTVKPEEPKSRSANKRRAAEMARKTQEAENVQNTNISAESDGQAQAEPKAFPTETAETAPHSDFRPPPNSEQSFSASAENMPAGTANSDIWEQNRPTDAPTADSPKQTNAENPIPSVENAALRSESLLQTNAEAAPDKVKAAPALKHETRPRLKEKQRLSEVPVKAPAETEKANTKRQKKPIEQKQTDDVKPAPEAVATAPKNEPTPYEVKAETVSAVEDVEKETEQPTAFESVSENTPKSEQTAEPAKPSALRHDPRPRLKESRDRPRRSLRMRKSQTPSGRNRNL